MYESFAQVYDTFMDNIPYDEWAGYIIEKLKEDLEGRELGGVVVHHINCAAEGQKLAQQIEDELQTTVIIQSIGPVIGCHVGPGSIGIAYFVK